MLSHEGRVRIMLLEERRSVIRYVLLNIITLGIYGLFVTADMARDTEVACHEDGKHSRFGVKEGFLSIITLSIYHWLWMFKLIDRWNKFSTLKHYGYYVKPVSYFIKRLTFIGVPLAIADCYRVLGRFCEEFNDAFFRLDENDAFTKKARAIVEEAAERKIAATEMVAGYRVIEEYDFSNDHRRVDHSAEEAAHEAELAALKEEERKAAERKIAEAEAEEARIEAEKEKAAREAHRNPEWFVKVFGVLLAIFMLPVVFIAAISFTFPSVYGDTFVGELADKYDRLNSIDDPKIVVVGGSSVAFGLDSEMLEEALGMDVVNFGLYANLGTKIMLDLSKANINKGDIIVIAPELNDQTLSLYFNAETALQAMDGNWYMLKDVGSDDYEACIGGLWKFAGEKFSYLLNGTRPENSGAYTKECFNEYGDNEYERPYNTMLSTSKTIELSYRVNNEDSITTDYEQFIEYVNEYIDYCERRGATVYFSFAPMNEAAMTDYNTSENIYNFYKNLCANLDCRVISNINDYIMDEGYFFDSEFHLNDSGVVVRTVRLINDIKRELGDTSVTVPVSELPEPSGYAPIDIVGGEEENLYFELELVESNGQKVWRVVGLNEDGMIQNVLKIPNNVVNELDGVSYPVVIVSANAFAGSLAESVYLGENIAVLDTGAFGGATSLKAVYVPLTKQPGDISVPNDMDPSGKAVKGANASLKIYVSNAYLEAYKSDYFWGDYNSYLAGYSN